MSRGASSASRRRLPRLLQKKSPLPVDRAEYSLSPIAQHPFAEATVAKLVSSSSRPRQPHAILFGSQADPIQVATGRDRVVHLLRELAASGHPTLVVVGIGHLVHRVHVLVELSEGHQAVLTRRQRTPTVVVRGAHRGLVAVLANDFDTRERFDFLD